MAQDMVVAKVVFAAIKRFVAGVTVGRLSSSVQERGGGERGDPGAVTWDGRRGISLSKGGCSGG